jgi:hypothetical protein
MDIIKLLHDAFNIRNIVTVEIIISFWEVVLSYKIFQKFGAAGGTDICVFLLGVTQMSPVMLGSLLSFWTGGWI